MKSMSKRPFVTQLPHVLPRLPCSRQLRQRVSELEFWCNQSQSHPFRLAKEGFDFSLSGIGDIEMKRCPCADEEGEDTRPEYLGGRACSVCTRILLIQKSTAVHSQIDRLYTWTVLLYINRLIKLDYCCPIEYRDTCYRYLATA